VDSSRSPSRRPVRRLVAVLATCAVATGGCSGGSSASSAASGTPSGSSSAAAGTTTRTSATPSASASLPGTREFGLTNEEFTDRVERTQALIAKCMTDAGFEYVPVDVQSIEAGQKRVRTEPGYTRKTYKEKWGLAVTTRFDHPVRDTGLGPQNVRIMNSLKGADREAYERTLWGDNPDVDFVWAFDEEDFSETGGCTRAAVAKVFTPAQLKGTYVNPKDVLVDSDPRIKKASREWSRCMRGHGYDYQEDQDEIIEEYGDRLDELTEGEDPATLTGERAAALRKLQAEEIEVALADLDCQLKHTDAIYRQVEIEVFGHPVSG
jgi:hypothetical protein